MIFSLYKWFKKNIILFANAGSLVGATGVTSILGFVFWWFAARQFPLESVGLASALVSAMTLLGTLCMLGLGTLLITELPRQPDKAASLISTALILVGGVGTIAGLAFALVAPYVSVNFQPLRANAVSMIIFSSGVGLIAISLVLDQAVVGLLRAGLQLLRNTIFAFVKLVLLLAIGLWMSQKSGIAIYFTWTAGIGISMIVLLKYIPFKEKRSIRTYLPQWKLVHKLGVSALQHHMLNMTLLVPTLILPVLVTTLLSAKMNAWFYVSWMIASFVDVIPSSLTTVLHAMNSAQPSSLSHKIRVTMSIAVVTTVVANLPLQFITPQILGIFGPSYTQAAWCLRILALCSFPLNVRYHYMSICRIEDRIKNAMLSMVPGGLLELVAASLGAHFVGLTGLALGWLFALCIESLFMSPTIYRTLTATSQISPLEHSEAAYFVKEPIWLINTTVVPTISSSLTELDLAYWETLPLPSMKSSNKYLKGSELPVSREIIASTDRSNLRLKPLRLQPYTSYTEYPTLPDTPKIAQPVSSKSSSIYIEN